MRKAIRQLACFAIAGAIINLLVVALLAMLVNVHANVGRTVRGPSNELSWTLHTSTAFGAQLAYSELSRGSPKATSTSPDSLLPHWVPRELIVTQPPNLNFAKIPFEARGWPRLSFWCQDEGVMVLEKGAGASETERLGGLRLPLPPWITFSGNTQPRMLPLRPIWLGVVVNSLFYAILAALLFRLGRNQIRYRRFTRGQCPACSYNIRHAYSAPCPECGWFHMPEETPNHSLRDK